VGVARINITYISKDSNLTALLSTVELGNSIIYCILQLIIKLIMLYTFLSHHEAGRVQLASD